MLGFSSDCPTITHAVNYIEKVVDCIASSPYYLAAFNNMLLQKIEDRGVVVQLVRIPACHAGGRGFESRPLRQFYQIIINDAK